MLQDLLKHFDLEKAKAWYLQHGSNKLVRQRLAEGADPALYQELIIRAIEKERAVQTIKAQAATPKKENQRPALIRNLEKEWKHYYKNCARNFYTLDDLDEYKREKAVLDIIRTLKKKVVPNWKAIDRFDEDGSLPDAVSYKRPKKQTTAEMMKRLQNLRKYISSAEHGKRSTKKLTVWRSERDQLEAALGIIVER